ISSTTRLVLVAVGRVAGDRIESTTDLPACLTCPACPTCPARTEGPRSGGRYVFVRPAAPVGFAAGVVRATDRDPFARALVSVDTLPLFALSRSTGAYVAAASIGAVSLVALDTTRNDTGSAQGTIATANSVTPIDLRLSAQPPRVLTISPTDQADNVPLSS